MSRTILILLLVVAIEMPIFGASIFRRLTLNRPPVPNLNSLDRLTRDDILAHAKNCRTFADWQELAKVYLASGFFAEAEACYQNALTLDPTSGLAAFEYGFCLSRIGKTKAANVQLQNAIDLKYEDPIAAMYFIGRNHLQDENPDLAEAAFRKASKLSIARYELAKILFRHGKLDEAQELLVSVLEEEPGTMRAYPLLSRIAQAKGETRRAVSFSVEGSEMKKRMQSPFDTERDKIKLAFESIGYEKLVTEILAKSNQGKTAEAVTKFNELLEANWTQSVNEALAKIEFDQHNRDKAMFHINDRIRRLGPTSDWLDRRADLQNRMLQPEAAIESWRRGANIHSDDNVQKCYENLAAHYSEIGETEKSIKYQLLGIYEIVKMSFKNGRFDVALELANSAIELSPTSAEPYYYIGKAHRLLYEFEDATAAYKKCLELKPTFGRAIRELQIVDTVSQ